MVAIDLAAVEHLLQAMPHRWSGPGGVAGLVWQGRVVAQAAWGHADLETARPMTAGSLLPICSISKQFTCAAVLAACGTPEALDPGLPGLLPQFTGPLPTARDLCNNQSGLRDYWALTILQGAMAEQEFPRAAAPPLIARNRSGHFAPGTRYSYSNGNFRMLADLLEDATGRDLAEHYRQQLWQPAGMETAVLAPDTRHPAGGTVGYEGTPATGYLPASNGIHWRGDAGISASLTDMLAWECWLDRHRDTPGSLPARLAERQPFRDGTQSAYGMGLARAQLGGLEFMGHGGALRGYRAHRMYSAAARLSVVVMFNHHGDAHGAARALLSAALGQPDPAPQPVRGAEWKGAWLCPETGLLARLDPQGERVLLRFGTSAEELAQLPGEMIGSGQTQLALDAGRLDMRRPAENFRSLMVPVGSGAPTDAAEISGRYHATELGAEMWIETNGPGVTARFAGMLGQGRPEPMHPVAPDLWVVATRRSMDAPAPGDWTLQIRRDGSGRVTGAQLGSWLARGIGYDRLAA